LVSKTIKLKTIKERFFADYEGSVKSLGAWGGDFILVTGNLSSMSYFENKGFKTIVPFSKMVK
jgi:3'-phosphoadenosine 5'-phosphosulfate sulfotransferase